MNCDEIQRRLLALTEPAEPPAGVQAHLDECPACQETQRRLLLIEKHVALVPVPPVPAKTAFLHRIRTEATVWEKVRFRAKGMQRWQVAAASLAASLLLFALVWQLAPSEQTVRPPVAIRPHTPDPFLDSLVKRDLSLAMDDSAKEQVKTLADLADDLRGQSQPLFTYATNREGKESLKDLADWYGQVVRMSVSRATQVDPPQRREVIEPIVRKLGQAADDSSGLARASKGISADHPLYTIASSARNGKEQLEILLRVELPVERDLAVAFLGAEELTFCSIQAPAANPLIAAAGAARAQPAPAPSTSAIGAEQAKRFQRNRRLIQGLVDCSLSLPEQSQPLQRSNSCLKVVERLADEIQIAAWENDPGRAAELSLFLKSFLQRGVAFNLTSAGVEVPKDSVREPELLQIGDLVKRLTTQLEEGLRGIPDPQMQERLQKSIRAIGEGRAEVIKSLKGRGTF